MIEHVRALVPGFVEWLGPLLFVVGLTMIVALVPVASVRSAARRVDPTDHWTVQARFAHAARVAVVWAVATVPAGIWLLSTITIGPVGWLPAWLLGVAGAAFVVLVVARTSWWLEGTVLRQPVPGWSRFLGGFLVRLVPLAAVILLGLAAPDRLSSPWMILWVLVALIVGLALRFQLDLLVAFGFAARADARLSSRVGRVAARVHLDEPAVYLIEHHQPNAFAFPWRGAVAITTRAVEELSEDELESVALHELGHMAEPASSSTVRQVLQFVWIPLVALKPILGSLGSTGLVTMAVVLVGLLMVVRRFASSMEAKSDEHAITNLEESSVYGRALEKIYRIGFLPAVARRTTHGPLHERMEATGLAADFDPPAPPPVRTLIAATAAAVLVGLVVFLAPYVATAGADLSSPTPAYVALSLGSYGSWPLERLGQLADVEGDYEAAEVFYAAAAESSTEPDPLVDLVYVRSVLGRCSEAEAALTGLVEREAWRDDVAIAAEWVEWCHREWDGGL